MAKVILEREKCIGCGSCQVLCPKFFELIENGKSHLIGSKKNPKTGNEELEIKKVNCIKEATEACPVKIIRIVK
ncbi:MAG: ferredoxin [Candidatus Nealsonbacteria bacterium CG23_combo_of_CG06-09_8_20_14_all_36_12]|uniref:Ferredoxin n=2 Tax=Candidatus Nealsoniibacteriota TaxID=1817911 RepID=A0A2H0TKS3_9BACT|nr:MAG: ferredoxin [Candidatus Nealsonbacteria bacterium CG23_combo_of_CG06-09_8_20_14_all_36_12]PIR72754.1 MAG: ferredoxin [Candidatus Nealsonbacteria bacterium CG10_big_fil_rev_8_21_14_0_10_36_23]